MSMFKALKKVGVAGAVLAVALIILMFWAFGRVFTYHWVGVKKDGIRETVQATVSAGEKLAVYRRMIADDAPLRDKIHAIALTRRDLRQERENLAREEEHQGQLAEQVAIMRDDLEADPDKQSFSYRLANQAQPRTFDRHAVEQDLMKKSRELTTRQTKIEALQMKVAFMERRESQFAGELQELERVRAEASAEIEHAELLRAVAAEMAEQVAMLSTQSDTSALNSVQLSLKGARGVSDDLVLEIEKGRMFVAGKGAQVGLDPRPAPPALNAVSAANAALERVSRPMARESWLEDGLLSTASTGR